MSNLLSLLRLVTPTLPVGGYSYSRGLEQAVDSHVVHDSDSARDWIAATVGRTVSRVDAPAIAHLYDAFVQNNASEVLRLAELLLALRESSEFIAEERNMGEALGRLLLSLGHERARPLVHTRTTSFCVLFALAAVEWGIARAETVTGYLWLTCESQVNAAVRLVPLGQTDGQRIVRDLCEQLPTWSQTALSLSEQDFGGFLPGLALASARHEAQYTRLFRS